MNTTHGILPIANDPTPWGIVQPDSNKEFCVLWLQGWMSTIASHQKRLERMALASNVSFAMLDYAGHGRHEKHLKDTTRELQFKEVLAAYDQLANMGYKHIIVAGASFGSYMAALLTAQRRPYGVILRVPAIYKDEEFTMAYNERDAFDKEYQAFKTTVTPTSDLAALRAIKNYDGSVYVIEQEYDSVIPKNIPRSYFEVAKRGNYLVVPTTDHSPMMMDVPEKQYAFIEHLIVSIVHAFTLEQLLSRD